MQFADADPWIYGILPGLVPEPPKGITCPHEPAYQLCLLITILLMMMCKMTLSLIYFLIIYSNE